MTRKKGFYWVKQHWDSKWNIAEWDGDSWMEFCYCLSTPLREELVEIVGPYIPKPKKRKKK